jgi:hypothetical protein
VTPDDPRPERSSAVRSACATGLLAAALGLLMYGPSLAWPMAFDDLHLLRPHSRAEIVLSFTGQWDRLMTRGYRPLSVVFNDLRYRAFGEHVAAQRLFLIGLLALYWAALAAVLPRLGVRARDTALAAIVFMGSTYSVFHVVWITDGNHMFQGLAFVGALAALLRGWGALPTAWFALSWASFAIGLLTREDTLVVAPVLIAVALVEARRRAEPPWRRAGVYAAGVALVAAGVFGLRAWLVPRADAPGLDFGGWGLTVLRTLASPPGLDSFDAWSAALKWGAWLLATGLVAVAAWRRSAALAWLLAAVVAGAAGLNVSREDLLFFPLTFFALALALAVRACGRWAPALGALLAAWSLASGLSIGRVYAENFHPESLRVIWWNGRYVYGAYARKALIPRARRTAVEAQLRAATVYGPEYHVRRTKKLVKEALRDGRRRPGRGLFVPWLPWPED